MYKYRNEAAFSHALCRAMKKAGWFVQRIESGETGKGIPDLFVIQPNGISWWLELKRVHQDWIGRATIPWRPGQQAWIRNVLRYHQLANTIVAFDNAFVAIPHDHVYTDNVIDFRIHKLKVFHSLQEVIK